MREEISRYSRLAGRISHDPRKGARARWEDWLELRPPCSREGSGDAVPSAPYIQNPNLLRVVVGQSVLYSVDGLVV